ncbi:uncharacterized protein LOC116347958 [Contarinia nasturtii]|uniref:uncharacterized protein LOC116347958 n=1 Tax=Contarinia nasturtii TaxID=265458 RepID=UPI0012D3E591|nr:uncharacterized protein LOC116347958 [Contarinia nasturtii]
MIVKINILLGIFSVFPLIIYSENSAKCYNEYCGTPMGLIILPIFPYSASCGNDYVIHQSKCPLKSQYCCPVIPHDDGVILCKDSYYKGDCKSYFMHGKHCVNVDEDDKNAISSVNTLGNCVRLYDDANCLGKSRPLYPGSPRHNDLLQLKFNDITSSFGKCYDNDNNCDSQVDGTNDCTFTIGILPWALKDRNNLPSPIILFQTGPYDRAEVMEAQIEAKHLNTGTAASQNAYKYAKQMGNIDDNAGHILSTRLGGSGTDLRNIFPQSRLFNHNIWSQIVNFVADTVERHGGAHFTVNLLYDGIRDTRPYKIVYRVKSENSTDVLFVNDLLNP